MEWPPPLYKSWAYSTLAMSSYVCICTYNTIIPKCKTQTNTLTCSITGPQDMESYHDPCDALLYSVSTSFEHYLIIFLLLQKNKQVTCSMAITVQDPPLLLCMENA